MEEVKIFSNDEFGSVRTVIVDGQPWFVGKDVADILGYSNSRKALADHVDEEDKGVTKCDTLGGTQDFTVINESGLYSLIFSSKLPAAKEFTHWVTSEVLPSIRKTGSYSLENLSTREKIHLLAMGQDELNERMTSAEDRITHIENDTPVLPEDAEMISNAVRRKGVQLMGGKDSPAYQDKSLRMKVYQDIYTNLKSSFGVTSYKCIKRIDRERALSIIERYQLPVFLDDMVTNANAQQQLNLEIEG